MIVPSSIALVGFLLFVAQLFLWMYNGPTNALVANCVDARIRTRAFSVSILVGHAFGDAISPSIVGLISDRTNSLRTAVTILPLSFLIGTIAWTIGWRVIERPRVESIDDTLVPSLETDDPSGVVSPTSSLPSALNASSIAIQNEALLNNEPLSPAATERQLHEPLVSRHPHHLSDSDSHALTPELRISSSNRDRNRVELSRKVTAGVSNDGGAGALQPNDTDFDTNM
jgi:hypothetical protein